MLAMISILLIYLLKLFFDMFVIYYFFYFIIFTVFLQNKSLLYFSLHSIFCNEILNFTLIIFLFLKLL